MARSLPSSRGTLNYSKSFNPDVDAETLYNACKSSNTDEDAINNIMGHRNLKQRSEIREAYHRRYQKDLVEVLKSNTKGDYDSLLQTMLRNHPTVLAYDLYKGMKGMGTDSDVLNEIICCCNNSEILAIKKAYSEVLRDEDPKKASSRSLEEDIKKETKPPYETLLLRIMAARRKEDTISRIEQAQRSGTMSSLIDKNSVEQDVRALYAAGAGKDGKGEPDVFINILADRSKYHIKAIWDLYKQRYGKTLVQDISKKFSDPLKTGLNTTVMAQVNLLVLMVCQLHESMRGTGTREDTLTRLLVLRSEVDMATIKSLYQEYFGKPLVDAVKSDTSGDYRKLLLLLLGN